MSSNDWKLELNHLLDTIEKQSTSSLETIHQHFNELGIPFGDEFRQHVIKAACLKLESSFAKINLNRWGARQSHATKDCCKSMVDAKMNIFVKTPDERDLPFQVKPSTTVGSIKKKILAIEGYAPDQQLRLIYIDRQLQDGLTMSHYNVQKESTLRLEIRRKVSECEWQTFNE